MSDLSLIDRALLEEEEEVEDVEKKETRERERTFLSKSHTWKGEALPDLGAVGIWMFWELSRLQGARSATAEAYTVLFLLRHNVKEWEPTGSTNLLADLVNEMTCLGAAVFWQRRVLPWIVQEVHQYEDVEEAQELAKKVTDDLFRVKAKALKKDDGDEDEKDDEEGNAPGQSGSQTTS